ncbi:MAG: LptF/LptG family permease [Petrimonas sp.]|nr:LptF/LptG family permease [Petrimonas sp.]
MSKKIHIKRLDSYLLQTFLPLFLMTFAICLFLVLMQFLWKYIADMVGKGLEIKVIAEMFWYAALNLIPLALPLSILLASLMVFGNLGEDLELLSIKSSGIPLLRTMWPLTVLIIFISIGAFFFQNDAMPKIQTKFYSLLISIRQKSPELDIPEGVFYKGIDGYNIYVNRKDRETGMLYDVMIYDVSKNSIDQIAVIMCDSAKMKMAEDKLSLVFTMYDGQQFRNFDGGTMSNTTTSQFVPYARENFKRKQMIIQFDANFNRLDDSMIEGSSSSNYVSKDLGQLMKSIDSMKYQIDSVNVIDRKMMRDYSYLNFRNSYPATEKDSIIKAGEKIKIVSPDSLLASKDLQMKSTILQNAYMKADNNSNEFLFRSMSKTSTQRILNRHWIEWHRKFTLPFACIVFFFIGAPLGSIVRKGGLGMPIVISVILFIIYYILDNVGYKMTRDGVWAHWAGMWFSSMILLPLGVFLTYKAMNDSVIMNADTYVSFFKKIFFIREKRSYPPKEVVIELPSYGEFHASLQKLSNQIDGYLTSYSTLGYKTYWTDKEYDKQLQVIKTNIETMLNTLSNSRSLEILRKAEEYPVLINNQRPFTPDSTMARLLMYVFPVGIVFKLLSYFFERRIAKDLIEVRALSSELTMLVDAATNGN